MNRNDPGDTRGLLHEYARGSDPIRAAGFWITLAVLPILVAAYLLGEGLLFLVDLIGRAL